MHRTTVPATTGRSTRVSDDAVGLRRLYLARFAFAVVWAGVLAATMPSPGAWAAVLLVAYPAFDVAAAVVDGGRTGRRLTALQVNIALSAAAAVALAVAGAMDDAATLRVWGGWAIASGVVQFVVARTRRALGGQWPMLLSGAISVAAGAGFVATAGSATSFAPLAGYAALGGVFFLGSALRLSR